MLTAAHIQTIKSHTLEEIAYLRDQRELHRLAGEEYLAAHYELMLEREQKKLLLIQELNRVPRRCCPHCRQPLN